MNVSAPPQSSSDLEPPSPAPPILELPSSAVPSGLVRDMHRAGLAGLA